MEALRHWRKVQRMESPGGWVRRVAIRDAARSRADGRFVFSLEVERVRLTDEPASLSLDVRIALLALPVRQRAAIALHYLDDRPVAEIASLLGCSESTVKTHLAWVVLVALNRVLGEDLTDELR